MNFEVLKMNKLPCGTEICMHKGHAYSFGGVVGEDGEVSRNNSYIYGILFSVQLLCATHFICTSPFNPHVKKENEIQGGDCLWPLN